MEPGNKVKLEPLTIKEGKGKKKINQDIRLRR